MRTLLLAILIAAPAVAAPPPLTGLWRNPSGSVEVDMRPCGESVCGTVVRASDKAIGDAEAGGTDRLIGTQLFRNLRRDGPAHWSGEVFVPDLGRSLAGTLALLNPATLEVEGCVIAGLACQSQVWTRVGGSRPTNTNRSDESGRAARRPLPY